MSKKNNAIVYIVNSKYRFALATMLINLQKTNPNLYDDVVIYHDDLSEDDIHQIRKIEPKTIFVKYSYEMWEKEHKKPGTPLAQDFLNRYSHLAWSKYKVIEQLQNYKKVLYMDLDMIIRGDLSDIFKVNGIAWRNGDSFHKKFGSKQKISDHPETKDIPKDFTSPNGGIFYISDSVNWKKAIQDGQIFLIKFMDFYNAGIDELVLAWIAYNNKIPVTSFDYKEFNTFPQLHDKNTKLIHFMGGEKPWNSELMQAVFPEWMVYYKNACKIVNFPAPQVKEYPNTGAFVKKKLNEQRWLRFLKESMIKLPKELELSYVFENEWLILNHNENIYYEFKFDQYSGGFLVGLWIKDSNLLDDRKFKESVTKLSEQNKKVFKVLEDNRGVYIYSEKRSVDKLSSLFDYFYKNTKELIGIN